jgi:PRTRC genetic system protein E
LLKSIAQIPESAIHALTTPLSLTGTPEEIDAELAQQLKAFVDSHLALQQSVNDAQQQIAEAVKAIGDRDKNRSKSGRQSTLAPFGFQLSLQVTAGNNGTR